MKALHAHQERAIELLRESFRAGHRRPMLQAPTGFGKTLVAAAIIRNAREKGLRCLFIVDALSLVDQTVEVFYAEGISGIGVIQADHPMTDYSKPVQIASVQTLQRRGMPEVGLVVVDEAHARHKYLERIMADPKWQNVTFIGLSATPWTRGLGHVYDDLLIPASLEELIEGGFLSPFRVFAPAHPDLSGVSLGSKGDYDEVQLAEVMSQDFLVADIVTTYRQRGEGRPALCFCVDRAHAKKVQQRFQAAGIGCGYIDAYTERTERTEIRKQLDRGEIKVVANVGCLTKGVDWAIGCIILARPTKSEMLYVQMIGRGLRVNEGIPDCVILDHSDNTLRLGLVTDIHRSKLCTAKKGEKQTQERPTPLPKECPKCTFVKPPKTPECPACGFKPERVSEVEEADGELVEIKAKPVDKQRFYAELLGYAHMRGKSQGWVEANFRDKFGHWAARKHGITPREPSPETLGWIKHKQIAWAKSQERRRAA